CPYHEKEQIIFQKTCNSFLRIHSPLRQTGMVDGKAVGGVYVVQKPSRLIRHERLQGHIEHPGLFHRTYSPPFKSHCLDCQEVEEKLLVQEADLLQLVRRWGPGTFLRPENEAGS
ncbi:MAG: hypothetical protein WEB62_10490, partial [Bacteroidota bacterium]